MSFNAINHLVNNWGMGIEDQIPELWLQEINKQSSKILEVGFGKGTLLKRLSKPDGPELYGIECSQQNYRHAINSLKVNASLVLSDISMERFQYPDGLFDVVIMLEVLEHIMSPMHAILEIQRVLKKDGVFIFSWPEERLISGIGKEEDQSKRRHDVGYHTFPYPGLFRYDNMRVFFNQMYFKIIEEVQQGYHVFFKMINVKPDRPHILDVVNGDYDGNQLFGDIVTESNLEELNKHGSSN
jgi:2-polyprenyl-3-methyl-5-hydroxy-6-metoxy-1,4-benzoquinol methylase